MEGVLVILAMLGYVAFRGVGRLAKRVRDISAANPAEFTIPASVPGRIAQAARQWLSSMQQVEGPIGRPAGAAAKSAAPIRSVRQLPDTAARPFDLAPVESLAAEEPWRFRGETPSNFDFSPTQRIVRPATGQTAHAGLTRSTLLPELQGENLVQAMVLHEVLGPPVALQGHKRPAAR